MVKSDMIGASKLMKLYLNMCFFMSWYTFHSPSSDPSNVPLSEIKGFMLGTSLKQWGVYGGQPRLRNLLVPPNFSQVQMLEEGGDAEAHQFE